MVEKFGKQYDELSTIAQSGAEMVHVSQAVVEVINELRNRETYAKQGKVSGIPTPLKEHQPDIGRLDENRPGYCCRPSFNG